LGYKLKVNRFFWLRLCRSVFICVQFAHLRDSLSAIRTIPEARGDRLAALGAGLGRTELGGAHVGVAGLIENPAAAAAFQEGLSPLDGNQGNEEKTDVMIQALKPGRG
jgi:hypothetical protein